MRYYFEQHKTKVAAFLSEKSKNEKAARRAEISER